MAHGAFHLLWGGNWLSTRCPLRRNTRTSILKEVHGRVAFNWAAKKNELSDSHPAVLFPLVHCDTLPLLESLRAFQKLQFLIQSLSRLPSQVFLVGKLERKFEQKLAFPGKLLSSPAHGFQLELGMLNL